MNEPTIFQDSICSSSGRIVTAQPSPARLGQSGPDWVVRAL
ncbi:hypothetical protein [Comamonas thiooxydans]|nr:hypothetical protein [Comamonas thiooxydans]